MIAKTKTVNTTFNCHNKVSNIKNLNLMHIWIYFTKNALPKFVPLTGDFQSSFHELFPTLHDFFYLCVYIHLWIFHFPETMICIKFELNAANTAHSYYLSSKVRYHLLKMELSILRNFRQTLNKIMKNQNENKNRNNTFDSHSLFTLLLIW